MNKFQYDELSLQLKEMCTKAINDHAYNPSFDHIDTFLLNKCKDLVSDLRSKPIQDALNHINCNYDYHMNISELIYKNDFDKQFDFSVSPKPENIAFNDFIKEFDEFKNKFDSRIG